MTYLIYLSLLFSQKKMRSHSPQDQIYGPLSIPGYCWPIIDTPEFQRLRNVLQLGGVVFVYPGTNHSRFEHSLGCAHLAGIWMNHFKKTQPELNILEKYEKAVIIAALCHDLGQGPYSYVFDQAIAKEDPAWRHAEMSVKILQLINEKYKLNIESDVLDAACAYIKGEEYNNFPKFLASIVHNQECDIDVNKFDYLSRDMNRALNTGAFEYDRLIYNSRVIDDQLCWKLSEIPTLERFFYNFNDMAERVYKHRVVQAIELMIEDIFDYFFESNDLNEIIEDPAVYVQFDDRILYEADLGQFGEKAKAISQRIVRRDLYKYIGEIRIPPQNSKGEKYSQRHPKSIEEDIVEKAEGLTTDDIRVVSSRFRYGLTRDRHPLMCIPFWKDENKKELLKQDQISAINPVHFSQSMMRVFVTTKDKKALATEAFEKWKTSIPSI